MTLGKKAYVKFLDQLDTHTDLQLGVFSSLSWCIETQIVMCSLTNKMFNVKMFVFKDLAVVFMLVV